VKSFFLLLLLFASNLWAQIETEKTVSKQLDVTQIEEAKPYLLHQAVVDAIAQYSTELGIDAASLQKQMDEKFIKYFESYKSRRLTEKFGKNYATELSVDQKKTFLDGLESHRNQEFIRFAKLDQLLDSYAFKKVEIDPAAPKTWIGTIVLNLNRTKLLRFSSRMASSEAKLYSKLQILSEINLLGLSWPDLGLGESHSFTQPLMNSWLKWVSSNQTDNVEEVVLCTGSCIQEFAQWQQLSQEEGMSVSDSIVNGLWLKISFNLRKLSHMPNINEWTFSWDGSLVLLDVNTKKNLASYTILPETRTFRNLDQKSLNSALASAMYRSTLDYLNRSSKKIQEIQRFNGLNRLVIQGHRHLADVTSLMNVLRQQGAKIHLDLQLDVFSQKEAQLLCFYQGEEKSFTDLLSRVKELKLSKNYRVVNEFTGLHHVLKLVAE
jgi:hypothetical protein